MASIHCVQVERHQTETLKAQSVELFRREFLIVNSLALLKSMRPLGKDTMTVESKLGLAKH